jgi:diguanylate cyclase (GGDEF)-like protein/PAS domain S-box-containing protein
MDDYRDALARLPGRPRQRRSPLSYWLLGLGWVLLGLALLIFVVRLNLSHAELRFHQDASAIYHQVLQKLQINEVVLAGLGAHFPAVSAPNSDRAGRYARNMLARYPHICMLQAQAYVPGEDLDALPQVTGNDPGLEMHTFISYEGKREWHPVERGPVHYPIVFMEPVTPDSAPVLGLDVYSVPHLRTAIDQVVATARPAASRPFELVEGGQAYVLFASAVQPPHGSRDYPQILVSLVVYLDRLVEPPRASGTRVTLLHTASDPRSPEPILDRAGTQGSPLEKWLFPRLSDTRSLAAGGQQLSLRVERQLGWQAISLPSLLVLAAIALSAFLAVIVYARVSQARETEREDTEDALRESEARYRTLVEYAAEAIVMFDADAMRFVDANRNAEKLFGLTRQELLARDPVSLSPERQSDGEASRDAAWRVIEQALRGEAPVFEWQHQDVTGGLISCEVRLVRLPSADRRLVRASITDISERKTAERQLLSTKNYLQALYDASPDMIFLLDRGGYFVDVNQNALSECGYAREELIGKDFATLMGQGYSRAAALPRTEEVPGGEPPTFEWVARRKDGSEFPVEARLSTLPGHPESAAEDAFVVAVVRDVTQRRHAQDALSREKERAQTTLQSIGDGVITTDVAGVIDYMNPVASQLTGCSERRARGRVLAAVFKVVDEQSREPLADPVQRCLKENELITHAEHGLLTRRDGTEFAVNLTVAPIRAVDGAVSGAVVAIHDVTKMREIARQLSYQAAHDSLTGLINRREFERRLDHALESARDEGRSHALCFMDLDQFKVVNDTCGHAAGDELLAQLAEVLKTRLRGSDTLARLGGDEFGVLLDSCPPAKAAQIAESLRRVVEEFRFCWEEKRFAVGMSMGLVPINADISNLTDVLSAADAACYMAKDLGRNRVYVSRPGDAALAQHHGEMQWVQRIRQALEDDRFELYCQPIEAVHEVETGAPHFEVLLRLRGEEDEPVAAAAFLPAAERYHLMPSVDRWVIKQAFRAMSLAHRKGLDITFSINLSGQSLGDDRFLQFVLKQLRRRDLDPTHICFEITETAAISHLGSAMHFIGQLRERGCKFALDDFGSGLSSFAYLKNMKVDYLKIDGNFVRDVAHDATDRAMVGSITQIGHVMGICTIAECAETSEVLQELKVLRVDFAQGFEIGRPFPLSRCLGSLRKPSKRDQPLNARCIA